MQTRKIAAITGAAALVAGIGACGSAASHSASAGHPAAATSHPAIATSHSAPASHSAAKTNANSQALTDFNKQYWAIKDEGGNGIDADLAILNDSQSATSPAVQTALGNFGVDSQAWAASADQASWHKALGDPRP